MDIRPEDMRFAPPEIQAEHAQQAKQEQATEEKVDAPDVEAEERTHEVGQEITPDDSKKQPAISFYQRMAEKTQFHLPEFDTEKLAEFGRAALDAAKKALPDLAKVWSSDLLRDIQKDRADRLAVKLSDKENALAQLNSKHEDFQRRMALIAEKIGTVDPKITAEIEKENQKFEKAKQDLLKEKEQASDKLERCLKGFSDFETKRDSMLDAYVDGVQEKLNSVEQQITAQEQKLDDAESEMSKLRAIIDGSYVKIAELETLLAGAEYKAEIRSYKQEVERLHQSIREKADEYNKQEQVHDRIADALIALENRRDILKQKIEDVRVKKVEPGAPDTKNDQDRPRSLFEQPADRPYSLNVEQQERNETGAETKREIQQQIEKATQLWNKKYGMRLKLDNKIVSQLLAELPNDQSLDVAKTFEKILILYHRGIIRKKIKGQSVFANEGDLRRTIKKFLKEM